MFWSRQVGIFVISRLSSSKIMDVKHIRTVSTKVFSIQDIRNKVVCNNCQLQRQPSYYIKKRYNTNANEDNVNTALFEKVCSETLESLTAYFEELVETKSKLASADISYSSGVLNINLGNHGTYVINRQSPNKQLWLSSPVSGPKRYDYSLANQSWVYKHDSKTLHQLLQSEISAILGETIDMSECAYS